MALTLTELMVMPGGGGSKRMVVYKVTGDGASYQINVRDLKMSKIEAAWTKNINNSVDLHIQTENYDYLGGPVDIIEIGGDGDLYPFMDNGAKILLFVIGY